MRRTCSSCGYCETNKCASYPSPMYGIVVKAGFSCEYHKSPLERRVDGICGTSVDCAKSGIERADLETLAACLERENRKTLRRLIESRIKKLSGASPNKKTLLQPWKQL